MGYIVRFLVGALAGLLLLGLVGMAVFLFLAVAADPRGAPPWAALVVSGIALALWVLWKTLSRGPDKTDLLGRPR